MENNKVEVFLRNFISSLQVAKIYEVNHPKFFDSLEAVLNSLQDIFAENKELIVGIVGNEFACGDDIFFELSQKLKPAIEQLKQKNIERIIFQRGVSKEELNHFIALLVSFQVQTESDIKDYLPLIGIKHIRVGRINELNTEKAEGSLRVSDSLKQYEDCLEKVSESIDNLVEEGAIDFLKLKFIANTVIENLFGNYQMFLKLSRVKSYDSATFVHLLNVSILSIYFSHKLGLGRDSCLDIGAAALLHDIGKLFISRKIIKKAEKLKSEEFEKIKSHTVLGAEILLRYTDSLGILPAVVAFEHHLGWNCKGYPRTDLFRQPHLASLIVQICDEYDALTQRRSYKRDFPPEVVYQVLIKYKGSKFSPQLLERFFKIMGLWPKGTIVRLSDSRIAIVREVNEEDIYRPKVEVVSDDSREVIDLFLTPQINICHALNPFAEGAQYLKFL